MFLFNLSGNVPLSRDAEGDGESYMPAIAGDASLVKFVSTSDLMGRNSDFSQELMIYDVQERALYQATNDAEGLGESSAPAVSGSGNLVVFVSSSNLGNGDNPDNMSAVWFRRKSGYSTLVTATSQGPFDAEQPAVDWNGEWIAFVAREDLVGRNPDRSPEIFLFHRQRKTFSQVTSTAPGCVVARPKLTATGGRIVFRSNCDPLGRNPVRGYEIFWASNPAKHLVFEARGELELLVVDPAGRSADRLSTTIPSARYESGDFDGDTVPDSRLTISEAIEGRYRLQVKAANGAAGGGPAKVQVALAGTTVLLADGTLGSLTNTEFGVANQGFFRRVSTLTPLAGPGSRVSWSARVAGP